MDESYNLVVEPEPDAHDLALLEERLASAAVAAAGVGDEQEFGIFSVTMVARWSLALPEASGGAAARCTRCGSTTERGEEGSGRP